MDSSEREALRTVYRDGLLNDTLLFWLEHSVDRECGGFITSLDRDGAIVDTDKGVWQQGRFTWLLAELYNNVEQRPEWLELAEHGIEFIERCCVDPSDNRMWFHVTREGRPIRKRRYAFSESFAAIAYGEIARATNSDRYAEQARQIFQRFISHSTNPVNVNPKYTDVRPMKGLGFPMICIATAQELRESIGLSDADEWIDRSIAEIQSDFLKPADRCVMETVGLNGEILDCFDGRTLNPGHAIEGAWFIMREGDQRQDQELIQMGCQMLDWMWERGWDHEYGGLMYFVDFYGRPVQEYWHDMKFWWPHCEAIIATLYAYLLTGDDKYREWHRQVHDWTYAVFPDPEFGEWYGYLRRDGQVSSSLKGNMWKGPFHMPRMQLTCWQLLETQS
jgi:N-acylglucosamine 2-epimerase